MQTSAKEASLAFLSIANKAQKNSGLNLMLDKFSNLQATRGSLFQQKRESKLRKYSCSELEHLTSTRLIIAQLTTYQRGGIEESLYLFASSSVCDQTKFLR